VTQKAYWFFNDTMRDGRPVPADGEWLEHVGKVIPCESGLHASPTPWDALQYAPGHNLALVELDGEIVPHGKDKFAASRRKIIARFNAEELLWQHSRESALSVIHLWDAPQIVRDYLTTGDESLRAAAWDAAWDAARAAARAVARDAAWDAAWDAARAAARAAARDVARDAARDVARAAARDVAAKRFNDAVEAKFSELLK